MRPLSLLQYSIKSAGLWLALLGLAGCASAPVPVAPIWPTSGPLAAWSPRALPGKAQTRYVMSIRDGRPCIEATSEHAASLLRRKLDLSPDQISRIEFDWWIDRGPTVPSDEPSPPDDAAARIVLAFDGDEARLPLKDRLLFELARSVTGESPPFASLIYAWDPHLPLDVPRASERSDRLRKIVVAGAHQPPGAWQHLRRDLMADFRLAYGEAPGRLVGLGVMTDSDNTASLAQACYGDIRLYDRDGRLLDGSLLLPAAPLALGNSP